MAYSATDLNHIDNKRSVHEAVSEHVAPRSELMQIPGHDDIHLSSIENRSHKVVMVSDSDSDDEGV